MQTRFVGVKVVELVVRQNGILPVSPEELCRLSTAKPLLIGWCMSHSNYYIPSPLGVRLCRQRPSKLLDRECQVKEFRSYLVNIRQPVIGLYPDD